MKNQSLFSIPVDISDICIYIYIYIYINRIEIVYIVYIYSIYNIYVCI